MILPAKQYFAGLAILITAVTLTVFIAALFGSEQKDVAGALGNVIGGMLGALGAGVAVYLAIDAQKRDEAAKVSSAIVAEVNVLADYPLSQLGACLSIYARTLTPKYQDLAGLFSVPAPVVYPAVAANIARIKNAALVATFYGQFAEVQNIVRVIIRGTNSGDPVQFEALVHLTNVLIMQCKTAGAILENTDPLAFEDELIDINRLAVLRLVTLQLKAVEQLIGRFPIKEGTKGLGPEMMRPEAT
jgi:hypothetical protein